jgi:hypothetical protein
MYTILNEILEMRALIPNCIFYFTWLETYQGSQFYNPRFHTPIFVIL